MVSPFPEGTIILTVIMAFLGYTFTGNWTTTILISLATFIGTLLLSWKFHLLQKFWKLFKSAWGDEEKPVIKPEPPGQTIVKPIPIKYAQIAKQNEERQKATLGYGLKSRNFKPRPAFEKKLWDLSKKAQQEEENASEPIPHIIEWLTTAKKEKQVS
jgi:uncharacterized membrane protein